MSLARCSSTLASPLRSPLARRIATIASAGCDDEKSIRLEGPELCDAKSSQSRFFRIEGAAQNSPQLVSKIPKPRNAARLHSNAPSKIINNERRKETTLLIKEELDQEEVEEEEEEEKENAEEMKEEEKKEEKKIYRCNICLYETTYKYNLKTHLQSAKHKKNEEREKQREKNMDICSHCRRFVF